VVSDVLGKPGIDLVEHILAVEQRPHFADGLVANPSDDAADIVEDRIDRATLGVPVLTGARQFRTDGKSLARVGVGIGYDFASFFLEGEIVDSRANVDDRLEGGMSRHIVDTLAIDPDFAAITNRRAIVVARSDHLRLLHIFSGRCFGEQRPWPPIRASRVKEWNLRIVL
jgi:hypothetical protein